MRDQTSERQSGRRRIRVGTSRLYSILAVTAAVTLFLGWQYRHFETLLEGLSTDSHPILTHVLFNVGGQPVRVLFVIKTVVFLIFLNLLARLSRHFIHQLAHSHSAISRHREHLFVRISSFLIYVIGIMIGVHIEQINLNTLIVVGGTLGVGVGFGLQSFVGNLIAGIILLVEQPIRIGDRIEFGDKTGEVVRVGGRSSWIKTYDNAILIIPNSEFVTKEILNWSASDPKIRVSVPISVAYGSDPGQVTEILLSLARIHPDVMPEPAATVVLSDLGASSMTFILRVWTLTQANDFPTLRSDFYLQILKRFKEANIEIPFQQIDLYLKPSGTALPFAPPTQTSS